MIADGYSSQKIRESESNLFPIMLQKYCIPVNGVFISPMQSIQAKSPSFVYEQMRKSFKDDQDVEFFVEVKYDGERLQIHYDKYSSQPIKIYSKSGRDSTKDRIAAHQYWMIN